MNSPFALGDKVRLSISDEPKECGVVVWYWWDEILEAFDYKVAFFGRAFPDGKPEQVYVLNYLDSSLEKAD